MDEATAKAIMAGKTLEPWDKAHGELKKKLRPIEAQITDSFVDGQRTLKGRVELMEDVSGYCNLVMDKTYTIASGGVNGWARALPLNVTIGIPKNAAPIYDYFHGSNDKRNGILLQAAGTWRLDAQVTVQGSASAGDGWPAQAYLSVWDKRTKSLYSERRFDIETSYYQTSHTISHTVIIEPSMANNAVACVSWGATRPLKIYGGDRYSALSVNRWDLNAGNANNNPSDQIPEAPGEYT
ncbi:hypothetical protein GS982_01230 [Rhodococcus hoagii]|nr:hypothetical protein [Prescottella equi]